MSNKNVVGKEKIKITKELIEELLQGCKNAHPNEFFAILSTDSKEVIDNFVVVPLLYQLENAVSYRPDLLPTGFRIYATIHSHTSGSNLPSFEDLHSFVKNGKVHFIVKYPYRLEDVACYDYNGNKYDIEIID